MSEPTSLSLANTPPPKIQAKLSPHTHSVTEERCLQRGSRSAGFGTSRRRQSTSKVKSPRDVATPPLERNESAPGLVLNQAFEGRSPQHAVDPPISRPRISDLKDCVFMPPNPQLLIGDPEVFEEISVEGGWFSGASALRDLVRPLNDCLTLLRANISYEMPTDQERRQRLHRRTLSLHPQARFRPSPRDVVDPPEPPPPSKRRGSLRLNKRQDTEVMEEREAELDRNDFRRILTNLSYLKGRIFELATELGSKGPSGVIGHHSKSLVHVMQERVGTLAQIIYRVLPLFQLEATCEKLRSLDNDRRSMSSLENSFNKRLKTLSRLLHDAERLLAKMERTERSGAAALNLLKTHPHRNPPPPYTDYQFDYVRELIRKARKLVECFLWAEANDRQFPAHYVVDCVDNNAAGETDAEGRRPIQGKYLLEKLTPWNSASSLLMDLYKRWRIACPLNGETGEVEIGFSRWLLLDKFLTSQEMVRHWITVGSKHQSKLVKVQERLGRGDGGRFISALPSGSQKQVVYLTEEERARHRVLVERGLCYCPSLPAPAAEEAMAQPTRLVFDTCGLTTADTTRRKRQRQYRQPRTMTSPDEASSSTIDDDGMWEGGFGMCCFRRDAGLFVHSHVVDRFHHSSLFAGEAVDFAGELQVDSSGRLLKLTDKSGHYKPGANESFKMLAFLRNQGGVDLSSVLFWSVAPWAPESVRDKCWVPADKVFEELLRIKRREFDERFPPRAQPITRIRHAASSGKFMTALNRVVWRWGLAVIEPFYALRSETYI